MVAERVIVSQLVRSPGVYYGKEIDTMGNRLYESTVIPNRGAWIELETDASEVVAFVSTVTENYQLLCLFVH